MDNEHQINSLVKFGGMDNEHQINSLGDNINTTS